MSVLTNGFHVQLNAANPEIIVPDNYVSIQEAINHAIPGDTINIKTGIYSENLVIEKNNLTIIGENKHTTIIDGQKSGNVVYVKADGIVLKGFTIKNSGYNLTDSGIYVDHSQQSYISDNNVIECNIGIYLYAASNIVLRNNSINTNRYNFGVYGDNLQNYIHDIDASNTIDGKPVVYWVNQTNLHPPIDAGYIAIVNSTNITIQDLTISKNWQAVLLAYSSKLIIKNVTATKNMDCIWILNCSLCSVMDSNISDNYWGGIAYVDSSACSTYENSIENNVEYGIFLSNSSNNSFFHNNFINNTNHVLLHGFNSNIWDDGYPRGGNFWSLKECIDEKSGLYQNQSGNDGICDTSFLINANNTDNYPLMKPHDTQLPQTQPTFLILLIVIGTVIIACCTILSWRSCWYRNIRSVKLF